MNDHVAKPVDPAALYAVLGRYHRAPAELEAVDGLDVAQGVRRVAGNRKLYLSLLRTFVEGESDAARRIRESLDRGERAVAERLAHTLKGTAGNLAAGPVQAAAGSLEKAIREGDDAARVESLRASLAAAMDQLTSALRPLLAETFRSQAAAPPVEAAPADLGTLKALSERWARLLAENDAGAARDLEREGSALRALFGGPEGLTRFAGLIDAYDFDGALLVLREAAAARGL